MQEKRQDNGTPLISVIIPVYNAERYLPACLDSIRSQTMKRIEVICVDDGSKDRSLDILKDYAAMDGRIRVFSQDNSGAAVARNFGMRQASGEFLFFIDSDDYIPIPNALERLYGAAKDNGVPIAGGSMCFDRKGAIDYESMHSDDLDVFKSETVLSYEDYQYDYDFTRFIYSRPMLERAGIAFPERKQFEDPIFHVHAMIEAGRFATIPDAVYAYRRFDGEREEAPRWSEEATEDRLLGITELLELSASLKMAKLHSRVVEQLELETTNVFLSHAGSTRVVSGLCRANSAIDCSLLSEAREGFSDRWYVIEPLEVMCDGYRKYRRMRQSALGRLLARAKLILSR